MEKAKKHKTKCGQGGLTLKAAENQAWKGNLWLTENNNRADTWLTLKDGGQTCMEREVADRGQNRADTEGRRTNRYGKGSGWQRGQIELTPEGS